jgi:2-dehydropantoate 2-reductase
MRPAMQEFYRTGDLLRCTFRGLKKRQRQGQKGTAQAESGHNMRVAIVGSGAVGGYFGAKLARSGEDVTFIARGAHLDAIRARGLSIQSAKLGDFTVHAPAVDDPAQVGHVDVVLFTVKAYDNRDALTILAPLVGESTAVLTLQNGVDSVDDVAAAIGAPRVLGGTTYVATALESPGVIVQTGVHRSIIFGEVYGDRGRITPRVQALADAMVAADILATAVPDGRVPIWDKFVYLAPFSGFTGAARLPIGRSGPTRTFARCSTRPPGKSRRSPPPKASPSPTIASRRCSTTWTTSPRPPVPRC